MHAAAAKTPPAWAHTGVGSPEVGLCVPRVCPIQRSHGSHTGVGDLGSAPSRGATVGTLVLGTRAPPARTQGLPHPAEPQGDFRKTACPRLRSPQKN